MPKAITSYTKENPYPVRRALSPIQIDGNLDEPAWKHASVLEFMVQETHETPLSHTEARVLWDDAHLYVGFKAADKDVWSYLTERDDPTCREDCMEIFFQTSPEKSAYYNFEINALGTIFDAFSPDKNFAGNYFRWKHWNCENIRVAVNIRGTLNDPTDVDEGWDLEVAIPFRSLPTLNGEPPKPADVWNFHLARYDYSVYLPEDGREITSTAPMTGPFNNYKEWLPLVFSN